MKVLILVVVALLIVTSSVFIHRQCTINSASNSMLTLEQKLEILARSGFTFDMTSTIKSMLSEFTREDYERPGFDLVLIALGEREDLEQRSMKCENLWHFDTECIEDHGDYTRIVKCMTALTRGTLSLVDIQDYVDLEEKKAWVTFSHQGKEIRVECEVQDDFVDPAFFNIFVELLDKVDPSKSYVIFDLGGQDLVIGCVSKEEFKTLKSHGLSITQM